MFRTGQLRVSSFTQGQLTYRASHLLLQSHISESVSDLQNPSRPSTWRETGSAILDFLPFVGNIKAGVEALTGKDAITGRHLEGWERALAGAAIIGGPIAKGVSKAIKGVGNFVKKNGGSNANDFISGHSQKHMYNPNTVSTPKKTQYGKDINVSELRRDTMLNPDSVDYDDIRNTIAYKKNYDFNISTPDTPTGQHRVFINLNNPSRHSQFPYFRLK